MAQQRSSGLTNIDLAENAATWSGFNDGAGGSPSPQDETDIFIQGNQAVSVKISGSGQNKGVWYDNTTGVDMSTTGRHLYIWVAVTTVALLNTRTSGGLYIKCASDASGNNWSKWYVGGSDFTPDARFICYVISLNKTPSLSAATPCDITSVRWFGAGINSNGTAKAENLIVDAMRYGQGKLTIYNDNAGDPDLELADFFAYDDTNKFGIMQEVIEGVYEMRGGIRVGSVSQPVPCVFNDTSNSILLFPRVDYSDLTGDADVADYDNLNIFDAEGVAGTGTTVTFGDVVGTGDDRQGLNGSTFAVERPRVRYSLDFETNIAKFDAVNFYGTNFNGAGVTQFANSSKTNIIGCTFRESDRVEPNDAVFLNNTVISPLPDRGVEMGLAHNIKNVSFIAGSQEAQQLGKAYRFHTGTSTRSSTISQLREIDGSTANPFLGSAINHFYMGDDFKFEELTITVNQPLVGGGTFNWEYWNGASWQALSGLDDGTSGYTVSGTSKVIWTRPDDWERFELQGIAASYYVRNRLTASPSQQALLDQALASGVLEHHVQITTTGSYNFDGLKFFGHSPDGPYKWHIDASPPSIQVGLYDEANQDSFFPVGNGTNTGFGQAFTGSAGGLASLITGYFRKVGSPTGDLTAYLYNATNVSGSSYIPNGAAIATSEVLSLATLTGSARIIHMDIRAENSSLLNEGAWYVAAFEYAGGDGSNYVDFGFDGSAPTHPGNMVRETAGGWNALAHDGIFHFYVNGHVEVSALNGANPTKAETSETNVLPATSSIDNDVTLTVTVTSAATGQPIPDVAVFIDEDPIATPPTIASGVTNASGIFTANYNYDTDQSVTVRARRRGLVPTQVLSTITLNGLSVPITMQTDSAGDP